MWRGMLSRKGCLSYSEALSPQSCSLPQYLQRQPRNHRTRRQLLSCSCPPHFWPTVRVEGVDYLISSPTTSFYALDKNTGSDILRSFCLFSFVQLPLEDCHPFIDTDRAVYIKIWHNPFLCKEYWLLISVKIVSSGYNYVPSKSIRSPSISVISCGERSVK